MRLLVVNSNTAEAVTAQVEAAARAVAGPGTEIVAVSAPWGPSAIEGRTDGLLAAAATVEAIAQREAGFDGFVIACYSDPGLQAARELTDKPIVGIAEASMLLATTLGHRFSILSPLRRLRPVLEELARAYGLQDRLASVRTVEVGILEVGRAGRPGLDAFIEAGRLALEQDGAEVLCLGGAVLAGRDREVSAALGVPALDGTACAVKRCEALVSLGLRTSKLGGYQPPRPKRVTDGPAALERWYAP